MRQSGIVSGYTVSEELTPVPSGPIRMLYWPVQTVDGDLCKGNGSTMMPAPTGSGPNTFVTMGTILTSPTVYLSFSTIYAIQGGFMDYIGPTFANTIIPFASSDISTQCGSFGGTDFHRPGE